MSFTSLHYRLDREYRENILRYIENERLAQIARTTSTPNNSFDVRPRRWVGVTLAAGERCWDWLMGFMGIPLQTTKRSGS